MERTIRKEGSVLVLGDTAYRITSVEGTGASSIVYRAEYMDALSGDISHHVFIKELFPISPHGEIYRDEAENVCCTAEGATLFSDLKNRFEAGNRANLTLLKSHPERVSGNLNSYEAYGTYYTVLSVHGGENLETMLTRGQMEWRLKDIISVLNKLLDALECFHRSGYLHLDISPDNILLLPTQALLIDYNSIWDTRDAAGREFAFSEKAGYSAPEVSLRHLSDIGPATDLYSVCAVFFRMLAGRPLSENEVLGNGLRRCFKQGFEILAEEPDSARFKVYQILARGLHTLPRKRYQDISALRADLSLLEQMIATPDLLAKDNEELYTLVYDNLLASLRVTEQESRSRLAGQKKRQKLIRKVSAVLAVCLVCVLMIGGVIVRKQVRTGGIFGNSSDSSGDSSDGNGSSSGGSDSSSGGSSDNSLDSSGASSSYTEEEQLTIDRAISCLESNMGTVSFEITAQQKVLTLAADADVLSGDAEALAELDTLITNRTNYIETLPSVTLSDDLLSDLISLNPAFPIEQLQELCLMPGTMKSVASQALAELSRMIGTEGVYADTEDREEIVEVYQNYLDACTAWLFYTFDYVLVAFAPEDAATILNDSRYNTLFQTYYRITSLSDQNADKVYAAMQTAAEALQAAQVDMTARGYQIEWE
ncbi:MAG: hypothetical protein LUE29_02365 [Lachnospiraceae bacterium]|nr:hypothetical protein [Lachnospiraceae bacterium]